jgi:tetratricopeptide (TPR) repeat protein
VENFRAAIDRDPAFALAYAALADAYALYADYNVESPKEAFPKAKAAALKALEIEPDSARSRTALAYVLATFDWDYAGAEREYKAAIALEPNYATAHQWFSEMLCALRRFDEAQGEIERAVELDPLVPITLSEQAVLHYYKGDLDASLFRFNEIKKEHPDFPTSYAFSAWIHGLKGNEEEAFKEELHFLKLQGTNEGTLDDIERAYNIGGYRAFLLKRVEAHVREVENGAFPGYKIPHAYARLGDREQTLYWIERCIEVRSPNIVKIALDRNFDFVRDDPRFRTALAKLNFPDMRL